MAAFRCGAGAGRLAASLGRQSLSSVPARGVERALVVADLPFMSYQVSEEEALTNAGRFVKEALAEAVKLDGGEYICATIRRLCG